MPQKVTYTGRPIVTQVFAAGAKLDACVFPTIAVLQGDASCATVTIEDLQINSGLTAGDSTAKNHEKLSVAQAFLPVCLFSHPACRNAHGARQTNINASLDRPGGDRFRHVEKSRTIRRAYSFYRESTNRPEHRESLHAATTTTSQTPSH